VNSGLWRDHPAEQLAFKSSSRRTRHTQAEVIIGLLREKRSLGKPLELPEIMAAGIAQHGARLHEIRSRGFVVVNETERDGEVVRSRYFLTFDPERDGSR
jgi:hypothetical protein